MEIVKNFDEKSYNNNGKQCKSSRILRVKLNFFIFLVHHHFSLLLHFFFFFDFFIFLFFHFFIFFIFSCFFIFSFCFVSFFLLFSVILSHVLSFSVFFHFPSCSFFSFLFSHFSLICFFFFSFFLFFFFFLSGAQNLIFFGPQFRDDFSSHFCKKIHFSARVMVFSPLEASFSFSVSFSFSFPAFVSGFKKDVSSEGGAPRRCGVLTTWSGIAGIGLGRLLGREHDSTL